MKRHATPFAALALFVISFALNYPLFQRGEYLFRGSIEGGYAGMSRFVSEHPNPWGWNPLVYCGLPTQFVYLPGLPYAAAAASKALPRFTADHVYRLIAATAACLAPVTVFLFALYFTGSRRWSFAAGLAFLLFSPAYEIFPAVDKDRGSIALPWRIQVLAKYGEGPHNAGLMLLPLALAAVWTAARKWLFGYTALAAVLLAAIALTNWIASLALAICALLLLLAALGDPRFRIWRVAAAGLLAYLLAAFWLTPSFIHTVAFNWPSDSFGYRFGEKQQAMALALAGSVLAVRLLFRLFRGSFYFCFVTMAALVFGWMAIGFYCFKIDTLPESRRYALEFEMFAILAVMEAFRLAVRTRNAYAVTAVQCAAAALVCWMLPQTWNYLSQPRSRWRPAPRETTIEYRIASWLAERRPTGRIFASGGLRFRLNAWFDLPQVGGGFESGLRNRMPVHLAYQARTAKALKPERAAGDTILMMKAIGVDYAVVHGSNSKEYYRDFLDDRRLDALPVVFRENDDRIYQLPAPALARLVSQEELPYGEAYVHPWILEKYVAAGEDPARRLGYRRLAPGRIAIEGATPGGRKVAVLESWDEGWRALQDGREIPIARDYLGFMVLETRPAAATKIELVYRGTREQRLAAGVSGLAWLGMLAALARRRRESAGNPDRPGTS